MKQNIYYTLVLALMLLGLSACGNGIESNHNTEKPTEVNNEASGVGSIEDLDKISEELFNNPLVTIQEGLNLSDSESIAKIIERVTEVINRVQNVRNGGDEVEALKAEILSRLTDYLGDIQSKEDLQAEVIARLRQGHPIIDRGLEIIERYRNGEVGGDGLVDLVRENFCGELEDKLGSLNIPSFLIDRIFDRVSKKCSE